MGAARRDSEAEAAPLFGGGIEIAHGDNGVIRSYYLAQWQAGFSPMIVRQDARQTGSDDSMAHCISPDKKQGSQKNGSQKRGSQTPAASRCRSRFLAEKFAVEQASRYHDGQFRCSADVNRGAGACK